MLLQTLFSPLVLVWFEGPSLIHSDSHFLYTDSWSHILKPDSEMTVKEPRFCFRLLVLGAMVILPFTTTISPKKENSRQYFPSEFLPTNLSMFLMFK